MIADPFAAPAVNGIETVVLFVTAATPMAGAAGAEVEEAVTVLVVKFAEAVEFEAVLAITLKL